MLSNAHTTKPSNSRFSTVTSTFATRATLIHRTTNTALPSVDGVPAACECPADAAYDGPCKHRVAVAIRPQILDIAMKMQAVTDGGLVTDDDHPADQSRDLNATQCDCDELGDFPC